MYTSPLNLVCGVIDPPLPSTIPRSTSSFAMPRSSSPALSPARPSSSCFLNISTPVTTVLRVSRKPTISTSSPTFTLPRSIRPVTTVPRPEIEKISSIGIRNGLRSEEHTSELQSRLHLVCRLLLEKKKHKFRHLHLDNDFNYPVTGSDNVAY